MVLGNVSIGFAFLAGLASFLSPCVFSLVPAYIGYLGGRSAASASGSKPNRWLTVSHGLAFVLGFSLVFLTLGLTTSALGVVMPTLRLWLARIGGLVVIVFGLHMIGILRLKFLEYDLRPQNLPDQQRGYVASLMMGVFFSAGWSPCVGPILGSILTLAFNGGSISQGLLLLTAYSAGLAVPFLFAATQVQLVTAAIRRYSKASRYVEIGMGVLMVIVGMMLALGRFEQIAILSSRYFNSINEVEVGRYLLLGALALLFLGGIPAAIAWNKGRNFLEWWFFGFGLFPVALVASVLIKPVPANQPAAGEEAAQADAQT